MGIFPETPCRTWSGLQRQVSLVYLSTKEHCAISCKTPEEKTASSLERASILPLQLVLPVMVDESLLTEENTAFAQPPGARKETKVSTVHGDRRVDDYDWLRDKGNSEVIEYLEAENSYTDAVIKST